MANHPDYESDPAHAANQCANNIWFLDEWGALDTCATTNSNEMKQIFFAMKGMTDQFMEDSELTTLTSKLKCCQQMKANKSC